MSVAPPTAAAGAVTSRDASDAERAHYDMVSVRVDIALRIQAQRRVQRERRTREAATPQVAETTGTPMSRRVRGGRKSARENVEIPDVDANPEVVSKAPSTPTAAEKAPKNEQNESRAEVAHREATRELKESWQKLFALAEVWPAQAVTSRMGAVSTLHERARLAFVEATRADERVGAARAQISSLEVSRRGAEKTPRTFAAATEDADARRMAIETAVETARPGSIPSDASKAKNQLIADLAHLESLARRASENAFDLNGSLACLMEAVDCEARAELRMAWEAADGGRLGPLAAAPVHHLPNRWPVGSAIALTGAFTGGLTGNPEVPTFAPAVPVAPLAAPVAVAGAGTFARAAPRTASPRKKQKKHAHAQVRERPMFPSVEERADAHVEPPPLDERCREEVHDRPKKRPRPCANAEGVADSAPRRGETSRRIRRPPPEATKCRATIRKTGKRCSFGAVYGEFCARHSGVFPTLPGDAR